MSILREAPIVRTEMLIRKPVAEVFEAFVDPAVTTRFWFTRSSGKLEAGSRVRWDWEMYGVHTYVDVKEVETNKRIDMTWGDEHDRTAVEWQFQSRSDNETMVTITNTGFQGDGDEQVRQAIDSMGGFTMVLCALKALLEHNVALTVAADKTPGRQYTVLNVGKTALELLVAGSAELESPSEPSPRLRSQIARSLSRRWSQA